MSSSAASRCSVCGSGAKSAASETKCGRLCSLADDASVGSRNVPAFLRGRGAGYTTASDASLDTSIEDFEYLREGAFPPGSPVRGS